MCTVTWLPEPGGYLLFFNRDEKRARRTASPPAEAVHGGLRCLRPVDGEAGGSWIGVNEAGVTACVLNHYGSSAAAGPARASRGHLLLELLGHPSARDVIEACARSDLARYSPFILLSLGRDEPARALVYDGARTGAPDAASVPFLSTSSYRTDEVVCSRRACYERMVNGRAAPSGEDLLAFHGSHLPERGPFSICMHREDAATVSLTRVAVRPGRIAMAYAPGPPCCAPLGNDRILELPSTA